MNRTVETAELYRSWPAQAAHDLEEIRLGILEKDFCRLGEAAEQNALAMHATMISSRPSVIYWTPQTLNLIKGIHNLRKEGLAVYFTIDAGPNVKILYQKSDQTEIKKVFPEQLEADPFLVSCSA